MSLNNKSVTFTLHMSDADDFLLHLFTNSKFNVRKTAADGTV